MFGFAGGEIGMLKANLALVKGASSSAWMHAKQESGSRRSWRRCDKT